MDNLNELTLEESKQISGGVPWWVPVGIVIAYNEASDIWESGGKNLEEAYESGQEWAENI